MLPKKKNQKKLHYDFRHNKPVHIYNYLTQKYNEHVYKTNTQSLTLILQPRFKYRARSNLALMQTGYTKTKPTQTLL